MGHRITCRVIHFLQGGSSGYIWIDKTTHETLKEEGSFKGGVFVVTKH